MLKGGCSVYWLPILLSMKIVKALNRRSGLKDLNNKSLWKELISLKALGKSVISGFS